MSTRNKWFAGAATLAMVAVVGVTAAAIATPTVPIAQGFGDGDGLNRFVAIATTSARVTDLPEFDGGSPAEPTSNLIATNPDGSDGDPIGRHAIDLNLLLLAHQTLGADGGTTQVDGKTYFVGPTGVMVVSPGGDGTVLPTTVLGEAAPAAAAPATAVAPEPIKLGDPITTPDTATIPALLAHPGVVTAQLLTGNQILISTTLDLAHVAAFPELASVTPSTQVPVAGDFTPTDPYYAAFGWDLNNTGNNANQQTATANADIDAPAGWGAAQGQDTVVAIVDSGFDTTHPELVGALWNSPTEACGAGDTNGNGKAGDCHGWNFLETSDDLDNLGADGTENGEHGTSVAGVVGARIDNGEGSVGVAPKTVIMPLVIGAGKTVDVNLGAEAIRYAADNGADVINASWGGSFTGWAYQNLSDAIDYATAKGVLVVAAAGNDWANRDISLFYPASMPNPGILTVGSTTANDTISTTSAYGATAVDVFAPGNLVFTTWVGGQYRLVSGTSIAAPHVTAAVALYRSAAPDMTAAEIKAAIMADSDKLTVLTGKCVSGGRLSLEHLPGTPASGTETASYQFASMNAVEGTQSPKVTVTSDATAGTYAVKLGLAMLVDGQIWAVSGQSITLNGTTATTNDTGDVTFPLGSLAALDGAALAPTLDLRPGSFGLTVQVLRDGAPLSRPYAAPMVVVPTGTVPPGNPTPNPTPSATSTPGATPTPGSNPTSAPGASSTPTVNPTSGGSTPGATSAPTTAPTGAPTSTPTPGAGSTPTPSGTMPAPGATSIPTPASTSAPTPTPGVTTTPTPGATTAPTPGATSAPGAPDVTTYPGVGAFKVTSISPTHVSTIGGDSVTITGNALESGMGVRVGPTGIADGVTWIGNLLSFRTPALVAGTYDVTVFKGGRSSVLVSALTYSAVGTTPTPGSTPGSTSGPSSSSSPSGSATTPAGGGGSTPSGSATSPGSDPGNGGGTTPTEPAATRVGPNGEHLVRNDALAALTGLWSMTCTSTCVGLQV